MADENTEEKKKGGILKLLMFIGGGILLIGIGLGVGFFLFGGKPADPSAEIEEIIESSKESTTIATGAKSIITSLCLRSSWPFRVSVLWSQHLLSSLIAMPQPAASEKTAVLTTRPIQIC